MYAHIKKFGLAIVTSILICFLFIKCTKIGSISTLKTDGIEWFLSNESESEQKDLILISNIVSNSLYKKGIETKDFNIDIILCNSTNEFLLKALVLDDKVQAVTRKFWGNIIINKSSIKENKMYGNNNKLSEIITHELAHIYMSEKLSNVKSILLETWKEEGFAEYISEHSTIGIEKGLSLFLTNKQSSTENDEYNKILYFYFTSRLKTDFLLGYKKVPFDEFIDTDYEEELLEEEIRTALKNETYKFPSRTMELNKVGEWRTSQIHSRIFIY
ncbi:MAG: hypothetical protein IKV67_02860 [Paludibacteraceae bacterium]|nr:hypothetical protein [Paludibacteraceae bacterium]